MNANPMATRTTNLDKATRTQATPLARPEQRPADGQARPARTPRKWWQFFVVSHA